jgi:teichoic acid transport system permease protein
LVQYAKDLWAAREFMIRVPLDELRAQHANTVLGNVWLLVNPTLQILVYYLIFGVVLGVDRGVDNFVAFLAVGVFIFQFSNRSAVSGSKSIISNEGLIRSVRFPRALLPISTVMEQAFAHVPAVIVLFGVAIATGEPIRLSWLVLPALFLLQFVFNVGMALSLARLTNKVRDIQHLLPFLFRLLFYGSGVLFLVDEYVEGGYVWFFVLNPFYDFVELGRWAVLGTSPHWAVLPVVVSQTLVVATAGALYFKRGEVEYGHG